MASRDLPAQIVSIQKQLQQPLPGRDAQERMAARVLPMPPQIPGNARNSAVLSLFFPLADALHMVLIQRTEDGGRHSGQVGFPGGRYEPSDADLSATALRETQEEVGVPSDAVTLLGGLTPLYIPVSNFMVHPFVGYTPQRPDYVLSQDEVAGIYEVAVGELFLPERKIVTTVRPSSAPNLMLTVPAYTLTDGPIIWGATAMMLSELEAVWTDAMKEM
jgi:8-oxo-dGTP pyrophosphatase MutT (NUDIX family)